MFLKSLMALVISLVLASIAVACTCKLESTSKAFKQARSVFSGTATSVQGNLVEFVLDRTWKGDLKSRITVDAEPNAFTGACGDGFAFEPNERYVVFINSVDLVTWNLCTYNFHITSTPDEKKYDKSVEYQTKTLAKLNALGRK